MDNINLPPFYIGQRVVRLIEEETGTIVKDKEYVVSEIFYCCSLWGWRIKLVGVSYPKGYRCQCGSVDNLGFASKNFAPIEENFETISYKEVIRKQKPLTCAN